jgi:hypothetical protein
MGSEDFEIGSGNVFADLELDDATELFNCAQLGHNIRLIPRRESSKQREVPVCSAPNRQRFPRR